MPLTKKGKKIMGAMKKEYGTKKGEAVFYASRNKGKIKGVEKAAMGRAMFKETTSKAPGKAQKRVKQAFLIKKKKDPKLLLKERQPKALGTRASYKV